MMRDSIPNYWTKCWDFPLYSLGIPLIAAIPLSFFTITGVTTFIQHITTTVHCKKTSCYFHYTFLRYYRYKNTAGQDQEFSTTDVVKYDTSRNTAFNIIIHCL